MEFEEKDIAGEIVQEGVWKGWEDGDVDGERTKIKRRNGQKRPVVLWLCLSSLDLQCLLCLWSHYMLTTCTEHLYTSLYAHIKQLL